MKEQKDDFWDIASLLPPKRKRKTPAFVDEICPATLELAGDIPSSKETEERRLSFEKTETEARVTSYVPQNPFIENVTLTESVRSLCLFSSFREEAIALRRQKGVPCSFVPFFSYIPQFYQMTPAQKAYYLYFRDEADAGRYIDTSLSYFWLYIYEIINLTDHIPPEEGVCRMAKAWAAYRDKLPSIDKNMSRWVADYGLVHRVSCPSFVTRPFLKSILEAATFKEFYLDGAGSEDEVHREAVLARISAYDYKAGRYAEGEMGDAIRMHVGRAAGLVLNDLMKEKGERPSYERIEKRYEAFHGALNASERRLELAVTYRSVTATEEWRLIITAAVKYAENKVRAAFSIKSRLSTLGLPERYKRMIDGYFDAHLKKPQKVLSEPPAYEVLYDAEDKGISEDAAGEIERASWENTWRLIPEEEREEVALAPKAETPTEETALPLSREDAAFLRIAFEKSEADAAFYAAKTGFLPLSACERINEVFSDLLGDIVLEITGDDFTVIREYETEVQTFLSSVSEYE